MMDIDPRLRALDESSAQPFDQTSNSWTYSDTDTPGQGEVAEQVAQPETTSLITNMSTPLNQNNDSNNNVTPSSEQPPLPTPVQGPAPEYVPSKRDSIRALKKYTTLSNGEIFRRVGVPPRTGYRMLSDNFDRRLSGPETRGRKRTIGDDAVKKMIKILDGQPGDGHMAWEELGRQVGIQNATAHTIRRALEREGYHKCKACQKGKVPGQAPLGRRVSNTRNSDILRQQASAKDSEKE